MMQTEARTARSGSYESIPLSAIHPSPTNPRKHIDSVALEELTQSIRELGVTVPILVRSLYDSNNGEFYEIVTGERRFLAAQAAGLTEIPAIVEDELSDADAMDLQLVENLQRADLHPMEEAEGFRALMAAGSSAEDVAKKAGKTLGYVRQRSKLLTLEVDAKQLFAEGHLTLGHALLLARLTPKEQERALRYLLNGTGDWSKTPVVELIRQRVANLEREYNHGRRLTDTTEAQLQAWITSNVLLQLAGAPWDLGDAELLPIAGACTTCPKRTGANVALFDDLTTVEDTCVDPACFGEKQKAFTAREQEHARSTGTPLLKISAKASHQPLEAPAVELRPGPLTKDERGVKVVPTKKAVVVAKKALKQGQWVEAEEGQCKATVKAIAVDGTDTGKLRWVCPDQACKVHKHHVEPVSGGGTRGESWEERQAREQREDAEWEEREAREQREDAVVVAKEQPIRDAVFRAMEEASGAGSEQFLRLLVSEAVIDKHNADFVCREMGIPVETLSGDAVDQDEFDDYMADEACVALRKELMAGSYSSLVEAAFYSLAGEAITVNNWMMRNRQTAEDRESLWDYARKLGVDPDAIAARVEAEQASVELQAAAALADEQAKSVAEEKPAKKQKKKLSAVEQAKRKAAAAKKYTLTNEKREKVLNNLKKRWSDTRKQGADQKLDGKSQGAGAAAEQAGA